MRQLFKFKTAVAGFSLAVIGMFGLLDTALAATIYHSDIRVGATQVGSNVMRHRVGSGGDYHRKKRKRKVARSVSLFKRCDFEGKHMRLPIGEYRNTGYLAKVAQGFGSLRVPRGVRIIVFDGVNFTGQKRIFTQGVVCVPRSNRRYIGSIKVVRASYVDHDYKYDYHHAPYIDDHAISEQQELVQGDHGYGWSHDNLYALHKRKQLHGETLRERQLYEQQRYEKRLHKKQQRKHSPYTYRPEQPVVRQPTCVSYTITTYNGVGGVRLLDNDRGITKVRHNETYSSQVCGKQRFNIELSKRKSHATIVLTIQGRDYTFTGRGDHLRGWYRKRYQINL